MSNRFNYPVMIPPARRTPVPPAPVLPGISWLWTAVAIYVGVVSLVLAAMVTL
jgi:hypothetical protein